MKNFYLLVTILSWVLCSGAHARKRTGLDLELAKDIAAKVSAFASKNKWAVSIAIVDNGGNLLYFERDTEAYTGSLEASIQKARSANAFRRSTKAFAESLATGRTGLLAVKDIVPIEGGLPIALDGKHLGGIGVSGAKSAEDEQAAQAGLATLEEK